MQSKATQTAALVAGLAGFASFAQAASIPGANLVAETDKVAYYALGGAKVDVRKTEQHLASVEKSLGHRLEGKATVYKYEDVPHLAAVTGQWLGGFTILNAGVVHTSPDAEAHELVHLVSGQIGNPGHFFNEGLAVALTAKGKWNGKKLDKLAKQALGEVAFETFVTRFTSLSPDVTYPVAGAFVESLIKRYGMDKVVELFRAVGQGSDTDAAFTALFGTTLAQAGADWAASL